MSANLFYSFSDDKSKQLGCINGFLQQFLTGRAVTRHASLHKTLPPPGEAKIEFKEATRVKKPTKNNNEETPRISAESWMDSSSCSTSSTLSPFQHHAKALEERKPKTSINNNHLTVKSTRKPQLKSNIDSPTPRTRTQNSNSVIEKKKKPHIRRLSFDGKESRESLKLSELPRLSLDSRQERIKSTSATTDVQEPASNRPVSSIVAKLMGLEDLPQYTPKSSRSEDLDFVSKSTEESDTDPERHSVSIYKEIDKRLGELDFRKSGKDLRALKHILDAMQRTKANMESISNHNHTSEKSITKPESCALQQQTPSNLPRLKTRHAANAKPHEVEKRKPKDLSPKTQQTCGKHEKFSQERRARSAMTTASVKEPKNLTKQKTQTSRQIIEARTRKVVSRKPELDDHSDMVHTPRPSQILNKTMGNGANAIKESMMVVKEQPSPVSVLDADFYGDEALSPVKKKTTVFRNDDPCPVSTQAEWIVAENTHHLYNSPTSGFRSYNIENIKETPNNLWLRREFCQGRSPVQPKSSYPNIDDDNYFLTKIITKDLARRSESWTDFSSEKSWLVLDIERLLFKDLIVELVHH